MTCYWKKLQNIHSFQNIVPKYILGPKHALTLDPFSPYFFHSFQYMKMASKMKSTENNKEKDKINEHGGPKKELHWGIVGCGRISGDFVRAMRNCNTTNKIWAISSAHSMEKAKEFAEKNGLIGEGNTVKIYGTYEEMFNDPKIDVVYIGNLTHQHRDAVLTALKMGKNVLCEKTMGVNGKEVHEMWTRAKGKGLFLMEGYWTMCFPIWREIMEKWLPQIGPIDFVQCDFGFPVKRVESTQCIQNGGEGYLMATGCYALLAVQMAFGGQKPIKIVVNGGKSAERDGIDRWANINLTYSDNGMAHIFYSGCHKTVGSLSIFGKKGNIRIPEFFWSPVEAQIQRYPADGIVRRAGMCSIERIAHPLPPHDPNFFYYPHAVGLAYEIDHINKCLAEDKLKSDWIGLEQSAILAETMDEVRRQLGVKFPQDIWK